MEHRQVSDQQDKRQDSGTPALEWIAAGIGLVLTVAMLGFIGWQAWKSTGEERPAIKVDVLRIVPSADGWLVEVAAQNLSGAMFWELSNDDGTLLDALRSGLGSAARPHPPL